MASGDVHKKRIYDVEGRITEDGLNNSSTKILPENSVVIALAGQGKTKGTVAITKVELCTNQSVAAFLPNKQLFLPEFLFHYLDSKYDDFREMTGDSNSRTGLNLAILKEIQVPNLTILEQEAIVTRINIVEDCILEIGNQISKTQLIKKQLINQIFSA
jgi:type I restriction enzyme S subunit